MKTLVNIIDKYMRGGEELTDEEKYKIIKSIYDKTVDKIDNPNPKEKLLMSDEFYLLKEKNILEEYLAILEYKLEDNKNKDNF